MKTRFLFLFISFSFFTNALFSQIIGGHKNGQSTPAAVKASPITAGGVAGDVNLFSGTYNSNYTLGSVSTVAGLNFTLQLSNSSTFTSGDNLPNSSGIPYGDGWNLDLPTISVSVEDFNKFTLWQANGIGSKNTGTDPDYATKTFCESTYDQAYDEGGLYWYAPMLNIPGVASGRLVYKYETQGDYVFVLHTFDRYIEAFFDGTRWEVALDDGTRYELAAAVVSTRNPSNQRVEPECYPPSTPGVNGGAMPNLVLPKTEILSWTCIMISNKNMVGNIRFEYDVFGKIDFFKVYSQPRFKLEVEALWKKAPLRVAARDIVLKQIVSMSERLVLDYKNIPVTGGSNLLDISDTQNVTQVDSMYAYEVVHVDNLSNWKNFLHGKSDVFSSSHTLTNNTNPYISDSGLGSKYHYRNAVANGSNSLAFRDGFLESKRDFQDFIPGETYKIEATITPDPALSNPANGGPLFDINLASGDPGTTTPYGYPFSTEGEVLELDYYSQSRSQSVFSTFQQAVKWGSALNFAGSSSSLTTENFFVMPANPPAFKGFHIQIGPAISDNNFLYNDFPVNTTTPLVCNTYFNNNGPDMSGHLNTGDDIPSNFGIGLPLHMMLKSFYSKTHPGTDYCGPNGDNIGFWWNDLTSSGQFPNQPTLLRKISGSGGGTYHETYLDEVKIKRYSKTPYMLVGVKKLVLQADGTIPADSESVWKPISSLELGYDIETFPRYIQYYKPGETFPTTEQLIGKDRNSFRLKFIKQLPIEGDLSTIDKSTLPTTTFDYWQSTGWQNADTKTGSGFNFNSNYVFLNKIVDPLGKITRINYRTFGGNTPKGYSLSKYRYVPRPGESGTATSPIVHRKAHPYAFQSYVIVRNITLTDEDNVTKKWHYDFYNFKVIDEQTPFTANFVYDKYYAKKAGYYRVRVRGPVVDGKRYITWYYHKTTEEDNLLWGKLYAIRKFDGTNSSQLIEKTDITYEAKLAFESPSLRQRKSNSRSNYYDYRWDYGATARPKLEDYPNNYPGYLDAIKNWMYNIVDDATLQAYIDNRPEYPDLNSLTCDFTGVNNPPPCNCSIVSRPYLDTMSRDTCDAYFSELSNWSATRPYTASSNFFLPSPDCIATSGMFDAPKFYVSRYYPIIQEEAPNYLNSYFIKKTKEVQTTYELDCDTGTNESFTTTTDYQYFDADYAGYTDSPGFDEAHKAYLVSPDNYDPSNTADHTLLGGIAWEPSWQLYSKKTYSDRTGGEAGAYTFEENFYLYDLINEPYFQKGGPQVGGFRTLKPNLKILYEIGYQDNVRNLPYETRITQKAEGQNAITKSTYYEYGQDWDPNFTFSITPISNPDTSVTFPCGENSTSDGDPGWDPNIIYDQNGHPCIYYHSAIPPPGYNCPYDQPGYFFWYCDCDGVGTTANETSSASQSSSSNYNGSTSDLYYPLTSSNDPYILQDEGDNPTAGFHINQTQGKVLLKAVHQQVEEPTTTSQKNTISFSDVGFVPSFPSAYQTLTEITERNRYGLVLEEVDDQGLITRYESSPNEVAEYQDCNGEYEYWVWVWLQKDAGLPASVTVGYGDSDALTTTYTYDSRKRVTSMTDPNGIVLSYEYDNFGRLKNAYRNGDLLQEVAYHQWQNDENQSFAQRSHENYVKTTTHVDAGLSYFEKAFVDPLGRATGVVRDDAVVFQNPIYDEINRIELQLKPFAGNLPLLNFSGDPTDHAEFQYEKNERSRLLKSSKNGLSINGTHVVTNNYCSKTSAELISDLSSAGLSNIPTPPGSKFFYTSTVDEDQKAVEEYTNALGQKVAVITLHGTAATVFYYDSQGNVKEVINPIGQSSKYFYNYLGQLYQKDTPDGLTNFYSYNSRGQLIAEHDSEGETRLYKYDLYGRMLDQARKDNINPNGDSLFTNQGMYWTSGNLSNVFDAHFESSTLEKSWRYGTYDSSTFNFTPTEIHVYLTDGILNAKGKLVQSISYDLSGMPINYKFMSYHDDGFLRWEIDQFNYDGITATYPGLVVRIDYPEYNLGGGVKTQNVDLNSDQLLDIQYYYTYDNWNRLKEVYAHFDNSKSGGHLVASYDYDDIKGVVTHRRHYASKDANCKNIEVDVIQYTYDDDRYRLTNIGSTLFDWNLYYDNDFGVGGSPYSGNYNGNINVSEAVYKLSSASNDPGTFNNSTTYKYNYDALNRLVNADALIAGSPPQPPGVDPFGTTSYSYDKIGNFNTLTRSWVNRLGILENYTYAYTYLQTNATNRLSFTRKSINGGSPTYERIFGYDNRGNLKKDFKLGTTYLDSIQDITYGRANLPWTIVQTINRTDQTVNYQYDANDARIYKEMVYAPGSTVSISEYYLRSASGQELGIYDFNGDELTWYVYGTDRVAKLEHLPTVNWPGGIESNAQRTQSKVLDAAATSNSVADPTVLDNISFTSQEQLSTNLADNQNEINFIEKLLNPDSTFKLPNNLYYINWKADSTKLLLVQEEIVQYDTAQYEILLQVPIESDRQRFRLKDDEGGNITISLREMMSAASTPNPSTPTPTGLDPYDPDLPDISNPPVPVMSYYLYDHLGNTRVVYKINQAEFCTGSDGDLFTLESVQDYFPYGKNLRSFNGTPEVEKFLTTGHQRDGETGFDYRGARFYDSDVGRFLSLDPLAMDFYDMSPYNYVAANPIILIDPTGRAPADTSDPDKKDEDSGWSANHLWLNSTFNGSVDEYKSERGYYSLSDMAILIAYPEDSPAIPTNQGIARIFEGIFGDNNGKVEGAGHAGIVIINGKTGNTQYFDFGRYNRPDVGGKRGKDEGAVRSSSNYRALRIPNWSFSKSEDANVRNIVKALHSSPLLRRYGKTVGALANDVNYGDMLTYAREMEQKGYVPFGGYATPTNANNASYCAKFARGVAGAGGVNFSWQVFTGHANVIDVSKTYGTSVIEVE